MTSPQQLPEGIVFSRNAHGREFLEVEHPAVSARIALQGAHIISCTPAGQEPLLWMSPVDPAKPDTALRGGIPICWPWFADERLGPAHGIARTSHWQLKRAEATDTQVTLVLELPAGEIQRQLTAERWAVEVEFCLGRALSVTLTTTNTGSSPQQLSQALHSYFPVADIRDVEIIGLQGCAYIDKLQRGATATQQLALRFAGEVDRIYFNHGTVLQLCAGSELLYISREGSESVVIWNPWQEKGARLSQFPVDGYRAMVCIEAANAGPDGRCIEPGATHTLRTVIGREASQAQ